MATPQRCACQVIRQRISYTPTQKSFMTPGTTNATQNIAFVGPMQHVGTDATPFSLNIVKGQASQIVPFYNLPAWTRAHPLTTPSALRPFHNQLRNKQTYIQPMSSLFYSTHIMGLQAPAHVRVDTAPRCIDSNNVVMSTPYLGGSRVYRNWQAVITATADKNFTGTVTGYVVGQLHHVFA